MLFFTKGKHSDLNHFVNYINAVMLLKKLGGSSVSTSPIPPGRLGGLGAQDPHPAANLCLLGQRALELLSPPHRLFLEVASEFRMQSE